MSEREGLHAAFLPTDRYFCLFRVTHECLLEVPGAFERLSLGLDVSALELEPGRCERWDQWWKNKIKLKVRASSEKIIKLLPQKLLKRQLVGFDCLYSVSHYFSITDLQGQKKFLYIFSNFLWKETHEKNVFGCVFSFFPHCFTFFKAKCFSN